MQIQNFSVLQYHTVQRDTVISVAIPFTAYCMMEKQTYLLYFYITFTLFIYFIFLCCLQSFEVDTSNAFTRVLRDLLLLFFLILIGFLRSV